MMRVKLWLLAIEGDFCCRWAGLRSTSWVRCSCRLLERGGTVTQHSDLVAEIRHRAGAVITFEHAPVGDKTDVEQMRTLFLGQQLMELFTCRNG